MKNKISENGLNSAPSISFSKKGLNKKLIKNKSVFVWKICFIKELVLIFLKEISSLSFMFALK
jgi:hypothetical protein